jgi:3-oxoacyl-[acyl-carrier protein] reductase
VTPILKSDLGNLTPLKLVLAGGCGGIGRVVAYEAKRQGMDVAILDLPASIERHRIDDLPHFTMDAKESDSVEHAIAQAAQWMQKSRTR